MSLRYSRYEDICLKAGRKITLNALNDAFKKLIENDNSLIPENSIVPKIWECTWFNDQNIPGYKKGDAVWINTEPLDDFTSSRYQTILNYLQQSPLYRTKVEKLIANNDTVALFMLCRSMVQSGKLFYIGDLANPVQLKVSVVDDNKDLPLDTSAKWKNFFILTDDDTNMRKFQSILSQQTQDLLRLHLKTYHLPENFPVEDYLLRDFANLDQAKVQRCKNIKYKSNFQGFDYVLLSVRKKYSGKSEKWFRMWSSGYLEHGGIVDLAADAPTEDEKTACTYTVHLDWKYGTALSNIAPTYEYENVDFRDMYCTALSSDFDIGLDQQVKIEYDLNDMASVKTRYVVSLTPGIAADSIPYAQLSFPQQLDLYETNAVNSIDNTSFMFYYQPAEDGQFVTDSYSYYCSGFSTTMFDRVRKQLDAQPQGQNAVCRCE